MQVFGGFTEKFIKGKPLRYSEGTSMSREFMKQDRAEEIIDGFKTGHIFQCAVCQEERRDSWHGVPKRACEKGVKGNRCRMGAKGATQATPHCFWHEPKRIPHDSDRPNHQHEGWRHCLPRLNVRECKSIYTMNGM